jgi:hypothetical protein
MNWFWINTPLAAAFFAAWTGIPLWLAFKHPDATIQWSAPSTFPAARTSSWPWREAGAVRSGSAVARVAWAGRR